MISSTFFTHRVHLIVLIAALGLLSACGSGDQPEAMETTTVDLSTPEAMADYLLTLRPLPEPSSVLIEERPNLDRETGYAVQQVTFERESAGDNELRGWKMGGTRITDPNGTPDPMFGYSLASHEYEDGGTVPANLFIDRSPLVEAEIAIWIGQDLPGPTHTREEVIAAISSVAGAIELVTPRMGGANADPAPTPAHLVADNVSHIAVIHGSTRVPLDEIDVEREDAQITIDGEVQAEGSTVPIMATDPLIDAVVWLANELPKHGHQLRTGDFVITGSLYDNPSMEPGQQAEVTFSTLGTVGFTLED